MRNNINDVFKFDLLNSLSWFYADPRLIDDEWTKFGDQVTRTDCVSLWETYCIVLTYRGNAASSKALLTEIFSHFLLSAVLQSF